MEGGADEPGQVTFCQASKAFFVAAAAWARSTCFEAWYCIEYETQSLAQEIGVPMVHNVSGSCSQPPPLQVVVRQKANALPEKLATLASK